MHKVTYTNSRMAPEHMRIEYAVCCFLLMGSYWYIIHNNWDQAVSLSCSLSFSLLSLFHFLSLYLPPSSSLALILSSPPPSPTLLSSSLLTFIPHYESTSFLLHALSCALSLALSVSLSPFLFSLSACHLFIRSHWPCAEWKDREWGCTTGSLYEWRTRDHKERASTISWQPLRGLIKVHTPWFTLWAFSPAMPPIEQLLSRLTFRCIFG